MKIMNSEIEEMSRFLLNLKLRGFENRMRNKFLKLLTNHLKTVQEEHIDLLKEYCKTNEQNEFLTITQDGKTFYDIDDVEGFQKQYVKLMEESLYIEVNDGTIEMLSSVKNIILNCDMEFSGNEALKYESYCELFENEVLILN